MIDMFDELSAIHRSVARDRADGDEVVRVTLRRSYPTDAEDLWSAVTEPERIARWFMPISGDLREGGRFQLEGNASGEIQACDPPRQFRTTFGGEASVVTVTLTPLGAEQTELTLDHTVPVSMAGSVAGALYVGPGWDGALLGLHLTVSGQVSGDPVAAAHSPEALEFSHQSVLRWTDVVAVSGATAEETEDARQVAMAQFAPHVNAG
jgi:uncharacterized protein YndB with AHSA1/START domain